MTHILKIADRLRFAAKHTMNGEGPIRAFIHAKDLEEAAARIEQLEGAVRIAYGQVQWFRKERKRAWDGDFVRLICEAAINGTPEPDDNWREKLRAELDAAEKTQNEHGPKHVVDEKDSA